MRDLPTTSSGPTTGSVTRRLWLLGLLLALTLTACTTQNVSLAELAAEAGEYDGQNVTTYGVVAEFGEDEGALERHFVLRDADENRVLLLPDDAAEPYVGSAVEVTGAFQYDQSRGRALHVDTIEAAGR